MNTTNIPRKILNILWKEHCPNIILDTKFVEEVIYPAMEEYAELRLSIETRNIRNDYEHIIDSMLGIEHSHTNIEIIDSVLTTTGITGSPGCDGLRYL